VRIASVFDTRMDAAAEFCLLNDFQRDFPLCPRPFAELGRRLGLSERDVIAALGDLRRAGKIGRVGAVFAPNRVGASTLAALRVPEPALADIAARIGQFPGVNHNYEREHRFNLWFVVTATSQDDLQATLCEIGREAGCAPLSLPLVEAFHIDLGFPLDSERSPNRLCRRPPEREAVQSAGGIESARDRRLIAALRDGLPMAESPYALLAGQAGMTENEVLTRLGHWLAQGVVRRLGVVVRHRALGYVANAMLVFDAPDDEATRIGEALADEPHVSLCYRRTRAAPEWPYNLFCMLHGRERVGVRARIEHLRARHGLHHLAHDVLFSRRCFKQTGAHYG
jgi:DNA-binding Lrp family transcriptional regulator